MKYRIKEVEEGGCSLIGPSRCYQSICSLCVACNQRDQWRRNMHPVRSPVLFWSPPRGVSGPEPGVWTGSTQQQERQASASYGQQQEMWTPAACSACT